MHFFKRAYIWVMSTIFIILSILGVALAGAILYMLVRAAKKKEPTPKNEAAEGKES
jgi:uncharacterized integral membrane protein